MGEKFDGLFVLLSEMFPSWKWEQEFRFAPPRRWRFDYAAPVQLIALEVEGGIWTGGRHTRGKGYERDCEKYNAAALLGWSVFRVTTGMIRDGRVRELLGELRKKPGV